MDQVRYSIRICDFEECIFPENMQLRKILKEEIAKHQLENKAQYVKAGCTGHCAPFIIIEEAGGSRFAYSNLTEEKAREIIAQHIINDTPIKEWAVQLS